MHAVAADALQFRNDTSQRAHLARLQGTGCLRTAARVALAAHCSGLRLSGRKLHSVEYYTDTDHAVSVSLTTVATQALAPSCRQHR